MIAVRLITISLQVTVQDTLRLNPGSGNNISEGMPVVIINSLSQSQALLPVYGFLAGCIPLNNEDTHIIGAV
jgi:hypothetical protein